MKREYLVDLNATQASLPVRGRGLKPEPRSPTEVVEASLPVRGRGLKP